MDYVFDAPPADRELLDFAVRLISRAGHQQGRDLLLGGLSLGMGGGDRGRQSAVKRCPEARRQHPPGHACDRGQTAIPDPGARRPVAGPRER
ncbi:hypothetical protein FNV64_02745 [Streptomyces sp. S1A1-7]|nr:hypothetical protein FNV64_02745 [Streptomyces sp. S1A1-7]QDN93257.1 hypothetical protein FNV61_54845 [Streptomyces sp. RLB3-6]QDO05247.1 hypothetical protein FNV68_01620 [Streptomyces sp. S1D4-23]